MTSAVAKSGANVAGKGKAVGDDAGLGTGGNWDAFTELEGADERVRSVGEGADYLAVGKGASGGVEVVGDYTHLGFERARDGGDDGVDRGGDAHCVPSGRARASSRWDGGRCRTSWV